MIRLERKKPSGFRPEYVFTRIPEREAGRLFIFGRIPPCRSYMAAGMNTLMPGPMGRSKSIQATSKRIQKTSRITATIRLQEMIWPIFKFLSYLAWATLKSIQR